MYNIIYIDRFNIYIYIYIYTYKINIKHFKTLAQRKF